MVDLVKIRRKARQRKKSGPPREVESPREEEAAAEPVQPEKKQSTASRKARARKKREATKPEEPAIQASDQSDSSDPSDSSDQSTETPVEIPEKLEEFRRTAGKVVAGSEESVSVESEQTAEGAENELLTFVIADENYAVEIERIVEIIRPRDATRVPNAGQSIVGIISLRGTIVTLVDLRRILGHPEGAGPGEDSRIVVVERDGETAGFEVDRVSRVIKVDPSRMENHPVVSANEQSEFVRGVFRHGSDLMILLDLEKVLA